MAMLPVSIERPASKRGGPSDQRSKKVEMSNWNDRGAHQ